MARGVEAGVIRNAVHFAAKLEQEAIAHHDILRKTDIARVHAGTCKDGVVEEAGSRFGATCAIGRGERDRLRTTTAKAGDAGQLPTIQRGTREPV